MAGATVGVTLASTTLTAGVIVVESWELVVGKLLAWEANAGAFFTLLLFFLILQ
jgi:hypothetical protein